MEQPLIIMGIDPGTRITGYGFVEKQGKHIKHLEHGKLSLGASQPLAKRLLKLYQQLTILIEQHQPDQVAIENLFFAKNAASALKLGHARGVAVLAAAQAHVSVVEYTPAEIKKAVVGYGRADKTQIQFMVRSMLGLSKHPQADAADALAVALCHSHTNPALVA